MIPNIRGLRNPYLEDGQPASLFKVHEQDQVPVPAGMKDQDRLNDTPEEQFEGQVIHPARWPRQGLDLKGKRVAVLGNGCSATQIVSALASDPEIDLYNFVRSGQWFLPR